jgi:uncharacterized membrane protein
MQWAIATAAFLASAVEFVEAFTIVLVVGVTINFGVMITILVLALMNLLSALAPLRVATGAILIIAVLGVLTATLFREVKGKRE